MQRHSLFSAALLFPILALPIAVSAQSPLTWGAAGVAERDTRWMFSAGAILNVQGSVDETFRSLYNVQDQNAKQSLAESYSLSDFNIDGPYPGVGLQADKSWRFVSFRWLLTLVNLSTDAVARRNYYLGVGDTIRYDGRDYDHLMIADGQPFSMEFFGGMSEFLWSFTPFTLWFDEQTSLTPSLDLGLSLVGGQFSVDAGEPTGTKVYQSPPVNFVVGGESSSFLGIGAPMAGLGAELRSGPDDGLQWIHKVNVGMFAYDGPTDFLTTAEHRSKDADLTYLSITAESTVALPLENGRAISLGVRGQFASFEGTFTSTETDPGKILAARERFDKDVEFRMFNLWLLAGLSF